MRLILSPLVIYLFNYELSLEKWDLTADEDDSEIQFEKVTLDHFQPGSKNNKLAPKTIGSIDHRILTTMKSNNSKKLQPPPSHTLHSIKFQIKTIQSNGPRIKLAKETTVQLFHQSYKSLQSDKLQK